MCTVSFIARREGYLLAMNRDEKRTRPHGRPPSVRRVAGRAMICPSEPGGGTWIALNDSGACLALVNWYAVEARVQRRAVSRGEVVSSVSAAESPDFVEDALDRLPLERINPFRLVGLFPAGAAVIEWRWNLGVLDRRPYPWQTRQWISSGFDEPTAQRVRGRAFRLAQEQRGAGNRDWLRRLHRSHWPGPGPFSTCMHREDAATVSYTEVVVSRSAATMYYHAGPPCQENVSSVHRLGLRSSAVPRSMWEIAGSRRKVAG